MLPSVQYAYHANTFDLASVGLDATNITHYAWDAGRLTNVAWQVGTALRAVRYDYLVGADLVEALIFSDDGLAVTRTYDPADRLLSISATSAVSAVNSFLYTLDSTGRRTARQDADGARTDWGYDDFDQLTAAARTNSPNGAADAAYRFGYQYDLIGNRLHEDRGQQSLPASYNNLNQLTHRGWAGKLDIVGTVDTTGVVVLVQGYTNAPPFYNQTNFLGGAVVGPGSNAIPIVAWEGTNTSQSNLVVYLPPTNPQVFTYDANGNLLSDGQRVYTWDEENRLVAIETVGASQADTRRSEFLYDGMGRRAQRVDLSVWNGTSYNQTNVTRFIWDGWLLLAEADAEGQLTAYHAHGLDLSGSLQGAGGIGGLLARVEGTDAYLYTFDCNGNVTDVVDTNGVVVAYYQYDPFGRTVAASGEYAVANPWRFSTKQIEEAWGLYYYGYRYYSPELGRWPSGDPIEEVGWEQSIGVSKYAKPEIPNTPSSSLYFAFGNDPVNQIDIMGLLFWGCCKKKVPPIVADVANEIIDELKGQLIDQVKDKLTTLIGGADKNWKDALAACEKIDSCEPYPPGDGSWALDCIACAAIKCAIAHPASIIAFNACFLAAEVHCNNGIVPW